jgi:transposase
VILRAASGKITWIAAADIIGISARSMRRWKLRYETHGYDGLLDRRQRRPSVKRVALSRVEHMLRLYREQYEGFNIRHFHQKLRSVHHETLSYSFVKQALQTAGLAKKYRKCGIHRQRRERKPCLGQMLHIDGSQHAWLSLTQESSWALIVILDDATSQLLYAQLVEQESTETILSALHSVFSQHGLPMSLYCDRASWAFYTPKAGDKVCKKTYTQVGRALKELGVEHIPAYSPQARGRSERVNRTLQDRLVNELKAADMRDIQQANRYIEQVYIPEHNRLFAVTPADSQSLFIKPEVNLNHYLCLKEERVVNNDNTVRYQNLCLQIPKQVNRATFAGCRVNVHQHLDGSLSIYQGVRLLGAYDALGRLQKLHTNTRAA